MRTTTTRASMHRRRGVGVGGLRRKQQERERFKKKAQEESRVDAESVEKVLGTFKTTLSSFAEKHRQKIQDDASFRSACAETCYAAGGDPLR